MERPERQWPFLVSRPTTKTRTHTPAIQRHHSWTYYYHPPSTTTGTSIRRLAIINYLFTHSIQILPCAARSPVSCSPASFLGLTTRNVQTNECHSTAAPLLDELRLRQLRRLLSYCPEWRLPPRPCPHASHAGVRPSTHGEERYVEIRPCLLPAPSLTACI